jgi:anaerobic magnesium-protoporphyrin IX monomethyl ester cyclase
MKSCALNKKRILLINPYWSKNKKYSLNKSSYSCFPSVGLGIIASILEIEGHNVTYLDMFAEKLSIEETILKYTLKNKSTFDYVLITSTTPIINTTLRLSEALKNNKIANKIIIGGVHATALPEEVLQNKFVDIVVRGEGEITVKEIINNKPLKNILGISYKNLKNKIIHNKDRPFIENLDELPFPAYHLMPMSKYKPSPGSYKKLPAMSLIVTRGCSGNCTFCHNMMKNKIRTLSAERIIQQIKLLKNKYKIKEICFFDDNFTTFRNNVEKFCKIIINSNIKITWSCFSRVDVITEDILKLMKKAGCHTILIGVESGNQKILDSMKKRITLKEVIKTVKICKSVGIKTRASYIFGAPGETKKNLKETLDFAKKLNTDHAIFTIMTPYPGTEIWKEAKKNNWGIEKDYDKYIGEYVTLHLPSVSDKEILDIYQKSYRKYYLRPRIIIKNLINLMNPSSFKQTLDGLKTLLFR